VSVPPGPTRRSSSARSRPPSRAGATALYDALYAGSVLASDRGRSLVVVFTDGRGDNLSWARPEGGRPSARVSNVLLQVVGMGAPGEGSELEIDASSGFMRGARRSPLGPEPAHVALLRRLAGVHGRPFLARPASPATIAAAFEAMSRR